MSEDWENWYEDEEGVWKAHYKTSFKPWRVMVIEQRPGEEASDTVFEAYHIEDLIDRLQEFMMFTASFRLRFLEGRESIPVQQFAQMLGRNYFAGRPDEEVDWLDIRVESGAVVVDCVF